LSTAGIDVQLVLHSTLTDDQLRQWDGLWAAQTGVSNPFSSPLWVRAWYRHYVPPKDQRLLWVTEKDRLIGVAPMYVQHLDVARVPLGRRLVLVGAGRTTPLEIPPLLSTPGQGRAVNKAVVGHTLGEDVAWSELCVARDEGWFLPEATLGHEQGLAFRRHQQVRACVVLRVADTWEATRSGLKRNVKESLRRARNRLAKDGRSWRILEHAGTDLDAAVVGRLLDLHTSRSEYQGSTSPHHDAFAAPGTAGLVRALLPALGAAGQASVFELELGGTVVAAQLVLNSPGGIYFHSSGFVPEVWHLSPTTALQGAAIEAAVGRGDRWVNFSPGPSEAKLRWSETLHLIDDFAYGLDSGRALARYTLFSVAKDLREARHTRRQTLAELLPAAAPAAPTAPTAARGPVSDVVPSPGSPGES
jgi:CelD/BcsL family acetyltransferase involved in cellulose biosynthesis